MATEMKRGRPKAPKREQAALIGSEWRDMVRKELLAEAARYGVRWVSIPEIIKRFGDPDQMGNSSAARIMHAAAATGHFRRRAVPKSIEMASATTAHEYEFKPASPPAEPREYGTLWPAGMRRVASVFDLGSAA